MLEIELPAVRGIPSTEGALRAPGSVVVSDFCEHCQGQRSDRARVLRALRHLRRTFRDRPRSGGGEDAVALALSVVRALDIPHFEVLEESPDEVIH